MGQVINENIIQYQEDLTVPHLGWKIILIGDRGAEDVSELRKTEPNIEDSADYKENLTYLNEVSFKLNNSNGRISAILNSESDVEILIYAYFNNPAGRNYPLKMFGGFVDKNRSKENNSLKDIEILAVPYFGKSERTGLRLTKRYLDDNGLKLYNCEIWISRANITGKILKKGVHTVSVKRAVSNYAKLDDGEWTVISSGFKTILSNADNTEQCEVYFYAFSFEDSAVRSTTVIVKDEGEQYPETFFYYPTLTEVIQKAFQEMDLTDFKIDRFLIPTFDGRRVVSGTSRVDSGQSNTFIPVAMVSNGSDKIYISGSTAANVFPYKNQIWEYNHVTGAVRLVYETLLNICTHFKLVWDDGHLIAFIDNKEKDEERGFIQYFTFGELGDVYSTVLTDSQFEFTNPYYRFHYSKFLKCFVYIGFVSGVKSIIAVDILTGGRTTILSDNNIEIEGFCFLWDNETVVDFYFIKTFHGFAKRLYKVSFSNGWQAPEQVCDWFSNEFYNNYYGYPFVLEGKIFISNYERDEVRFFNLASQEFSENLCPDKMFVYSPFEIFERLYFIQYDSETFTQRICYFSEDEIVEESNYISPYDLVSQVGIYGFQQLTNFTDINELEVIGALSRNPALLLKFADNIEPFIEGELDSSGKTIRDVLQDLANNFLAFLKVDYNKKGWFVKRASYTSGSKAVFKKKYTAERINEFVYNEKYDCVEIENSRGIKQIWGDTGIDAVRLSLKLDFIPDDYVKDIAKYFYNFYQVLRKLYVISYLPTFYNYESLDEADLNDYGLADGIIHKRRPGTTRAEFEVLVNE